jgi:hypothetical protein
MARVFDPGQAGIGVFVHAQGLARTRLPSGKIERHPAIRAATNMACGQHQAVGEITTPLPMALPISQGNQGGRHAATRLVTCRLDGLEIVKRNRAGPGQAAGNELRSPCAGRRGPRRAAPWADGTDPGSAAMATAAIPRTSNAPLLGGVRNHLDSQNQSTTHSSLEAHPPAAIQALLNLNF